MNYELGSPIVLLQPDYYIYIGWVIMVVLSAVALTVCWKAKRTWMKLATVLPLLLAWYVFIYGSYIGFYKFEVKHVELVFDDLPPAFDGYKIVQWSDAHVGTLTTERRKHILQTAVDSINAQGADMVAFTGDLQNKSSKEIAPFKKLLGSIKAKDGVFSVLGNHDYPMYYDDAEDDFERYADFGRRCSMDDDMGWRLLRNQHTFIRRGNDRIVIAGMENDGEGSFPELGDIQSTLWSLNTDEFVVMLEHDPSSWRRKILPHSHTQLTLSGHTHAMQFALFGLSPVSMKYKEAWGLYRIGQRAIYVSKGLSGVVPFRFGTPGEIVVITLHRNEK